MTLQSEQQTTSRARVKAPVTRTLSSAQNAATSAEKTPMPAPPASGAPAPVPAGSAASHEPLAVVAATGPVTAGSEIHPELAGRSHVLTTHEFKVFYGKTCALHGITMQIPVGQVTALIGPSGCGKSTLVRSFNRLNDLIENVRTEGSIRFHGQNIHDRKVDVIRLRKRMGMVFQKSNPFPMSIFENVVYALRISGQRKRAVLEEVCERALRDAALWDEVKDRLHQSALGLSGGQQQRLCIARAIAAEPEVLLMDEPCSALDPIATAKIEELIERLRGRFTVVIVTHNMQQAARCSDYTAFMYMGRLIEYGPTNTLFLNPRLKETEAYVTGRFG